MRTGLGGQSSAHTSFSFCQVACAAHLTALGQYIYIYIYIPALATGLERVGLNYLPHELPLPLSTSPSVSRSTPTFLFHFTL